KTETVSLINRDQCKRDFTIGYLRGLVDTDGYLDFKDRAIKYCTVSKDSAKDIESLLWRLGIRNKTYIYNDKRGNRKTTFRVTVTRDFEKFVNIIKPFHFNYIDALVV
ncbi:MAG: LAGLIDADG family homing endonuclease, partial [Candidatus Micrarchaeota archaeon]|nr:LAGLIDADG family homing endonuclease [Candidatus Micrarchaeota archaeon]